MTRTRTTTPWYGSNQESKMSARVGAAGVAAPAAGCRCTIASRISSVPDPLLGAGEDGVRGVEADDVLDLVAHPLRLGARQVDLVEHRDDREVVVEGEVDVGQRLRLHALRRVDDQDRALAGRQAARHLVGEVDVPGRVDQVEDVVVAVAGAVARGAPLRALMVMPRSRSRSMSSRNCADISRFGDRARCARAGDRRASTCRGRCGR